MIDGGGGGVKFYISIGTFCRNLKPSSGKSAFVHLNVCTKIKLDVFSHFQTRRRWRLNKVWGVYIRPSRIYILDNGFGLFIRVLLTLTLHKSNRECTRISARNYGVRFAALPLSSGYMEHWRTRRRAKIY